MKNFLTKFKWFIIGGAIFASAGLVSAYSVSVPNSPSKGAYLSGLANGNYQTNAACPNGQILAASSTNSSGWACTTNTAALGATTTITSNILINGPSFTFATGTPATGLDTFITGSGSTITWTNALQAGYNIPLTASTTNWNNFYNTPSTRITAGTNLGWSGNTLSVSDPFTVTKITSTNASTTNQSITGLSNTFLAVDSVGRVIATTSPQIAGTYVTNVTGSGNIASSGGTTPNITFTGVLPVANGGTATNTLGSLTVSSSNLSITGGQSVLIGTSTQITLTANPTFTNLTTTNASTTGFTASGASFLQNATLSGTLNVTGQTTLGNASTSALSVSGVTWHTGQLNFVNASGTALTLSGNAYLATTTITGTLNVTGVPTFSGLPDCNGTSYLQRTSGLFGCSVPAGGGGGSGVGWASSTNATGAFVYNTFGNMVGINSTSPYSALVVQGASGSTTPVFTVASSTGTAYLTVASNGSTTLSSLASAGCVGSTSTGGLYVTACGSGGSGNSAWLFGSGLIYNATTTDSVLIGTTTPTTAKLFVQGSGSKLPLVIASSSGSTLLQVDTFGSTTIANLNTAGLVRSTSGGSLFNGQASLTSDVSGILPIVNGGTNSSTLGSTLVGFVNNDTNVTGTISNNTLNLGWSGILALARGGIGTTTLGNLSLGSNLSFTSGDGKLSIIGTSTTIGLGTNVVTSVSTGTTGTVLGASISSNNLTINLPFASAVNTGQLQFTDWLTFNNKLGGQGSPGFSVSYTGVGTTTANGILRDNGTVAGINATSSTVNFLIQGTGANTAFQVNTSTGISILKVNPNLTIGINTTTSASVLYVQGTSTYPTLPVLTVASSSGSSLFNVGANGLIGIGTTTAPALLTLQGVAGSVNDLFDIASSSGSNILSVTLPTTALYNILQVGTTTAGSLFVVDSIGNLFANHLVGSSTIPTIATSTGVGVGAGTSASVQSGSTDIAGLVHWQTTNAPAVNSTIVTVTFTRPYTSLPFCSITSGNSTSTVDSSKFYASTTAASLLIKSSVNTAITASTTYDVYYNCVGQLGG